MSKTITIVSQDPQDALLFGSMLDRFYDITPCGDRRRDLSQATDEEVAECVRQSSLLVAIGGGPKVDAALKAAEQAKVVVVRYVEYKRHRLTATPGAGHLVVDAGEGLGQAATFPTGARSPPTSLAVMVARERPAEDGTRVAYECVAWRTSGDEDARETFTVTADGLSEWRPV